MRMPWSGVPSFEVHSAISAVPHRYSACWGLASVSFTMSVMSPSVTQRSGYSRKSWRVMSQRSASSAWPPKLKRMDLSAMTTCSGAASRSVRPR